MQITIAPTIFNSVFIAGSLKLHVSGRTLFANYTTKSGIFARNFLLRRPGERHVQGREAGRFEPVRFRQRNRVQEDFGDGQIACAMMTMVFGSEPSRPHIGIWLGCLTLRY